MIDFIVMRAEQRVVCKDVQVMRGANCWTYGSLFCQKKEKISLPFAIHTLKALPIGMNTVKCWSSICWLDHSELEIPPSATEML